MCRVLTGLSGSVGRHSSTLPAAQTTLETAKQDGRFKTLVAAIGKSNAAKTLAGKGPFTVFAPTDAAFAKLDQKVVRDLLKKRNQATLDNILSYHVAAGDYRAADVVSRSGLAMANGQQLAINVHEDFDDVVPSCVRDDGSTLRTAVMGAALDVTVAVHEHYQKADGIVDEDAVRTAARRMASIVDQQNAGDADYRPMTADLDGSIPFRAALELVLAGRQQKNGYTEAILRRHRLAQKAALATG